MNFCKARINTRERIAPIMAMKIGMLAFLVIYTIALITTVLGSASKEARLLADLEQDYNRRARPVSRPTDLLVVGVTFSLKKIESLEERDQVLTSFGWLKLTWKDVHLQWSPLRYGNLKQISLPSEEVWMPELVLYNSVDEGTVISAHSEYGVRIQHTGEVVFLPGMKWRTFCKVDLRYFPFDKQACNVTFANWNSNGSVVFQPRRISTALYEPHDSWELVGKKIGSALRVFDLNTAERIPEVYFTVHLVRKPSYYVTATIIPCIVVSALSGMVFLLPVESGEKVSLAITVSLSYTVLLLMISEITPKSGISLPYLMNFMIFNMCQTSLSLMMTVLVLSLYHHSPGTRPPACIRLVVLKCLGTLIGMCHLSKGGCARCPGNGTTTDSNKVDVISIEGKSTTKKTTTLEEAGKTHGMTGTSGEGNEESTATVAVPRAVTKYLEYRLERARESAKLDENQEEWQALARVTDRICLVLTSGLTLFGVIAFMVAMNGDPLF